MVFLMALEATIERLADGCAVVNLRGNLTLGTNLKTVDANLQQWMAEGANKLVLDMAECSYCDSAGLGMLVHARGLAGQHGGALRLCSLNERVAGLLRMTHVDAILPCDPDRAASLAQLGVTAESNS